ncbi:YfiR family protein [Sphingomonas crusticola]|uniref:YfiR family protein n=1 Tax=Sphingomonas crusticola TaxID=1697973 RepID=UPI0013C2BC33|nr:YfiR family protein [Sphingomonas crusticola]
MTRLFTFLILAMGPSLAMAADLPLEYAVKASYLYKFAPFVQWPATALGSAGDPLTICIVGQDPFGRMLDDAVRGQRVNGRPIAVRHIDGANAGKPCHILFAGSGESAEDMLHNVAGQPVLTVTDRSRGVSGGMIQFVMVGGRVRFMIDQGAAANSGITISSKLLGLAVSVAR